MYVHLVGQVITILWATSFYHAVVGMFIPIAGRSGGSHNPDVTISFLCCVFTLFITSYIVSDRKLASSRKKIFSLFKF